MDLKLTLYLNVCILLFGVIYVPFAIPFDLKVRRKPALICKRKKEEKKQFQDEECEGGKLEFFFVFFCQRQNPQK